MSDVQPGPRPPGPPFYVLITAAALLALYAGLTIAMMVEYAPAGGAQWDRVLVIYNGFTAFAAAAAGALLGTQVQRANVAAARGEAEKAKSAIRSALAATESGGATESARAGADVRATLLRGL